MIVQYTHCIDYEGDHTQPYTAILGCRVSNLDVVPHGMAGRSFNGGNYIKRTAKGDLTKGLIVNEWSKIWDLDLERRYTADFEVLEKRHKILQLLKLIFLLQLNNLIS